MSRARTPLALIAVALLLFSACASGSDGAALDPRVVAGEASLASLDLTGSYNTTEMVDVRTGAVSSLQDQVTGDRAVVLWYWAPD